MRTPYPTLLKMIDELAVRNSGSTSTGSARHAAGQTHSVLPVLANDNFERLVVIALFICAMACYANTLTNSFVYDDDQQILQNPYIKSWHYLPEILTTTVWSFVGNAGTSNYYRPLMTLTYLVLWHFFGNLPFGYHLFNIFLNALIVVAVYYAGRDLFRDRGIAAVGAFLFCIHPIHTETVCWIAAVPDLEATLFILVAFRAYVNIAASDRSKQLLGKQLIVVLSLLLALLAKEPSLMLVPLLVLYEHFVRGDRSQTTILGKAARYLPVCLGGIAYLICRILLLGKLAPVLQHAQVTWPQAFYSAFALVARYTQLLLWPSKLSAFHVFHASTSIAEGPVLVGLAIVLLTIVMISLCVKKYPDLAFSFVWIGFMLAPVLNSRWMASNVLAERYLYLPSVGFCWISAWCAKRIWETLGKDSTWRLPLKLAFSTALAAIFMLGATKTIARNRDWSDDVTLYTETIRTDPNSYVMHLNLGTAYYERRNFAGAEKEYKQALILKPDSVNVLNALGCLYMELGDADKSNYMFQKAIELKPAWSDPHFNYGRLLQKAGNRAEALAQFRKAVEVGPLNSSARLYFAQALESANDTRSAEEEYRKSLDLSPSPEAAKGLIGILLNSGRMAEAESRMHDLVNKYPYDGEMHLKLGKLLEAQGRKQEALKEYLAAQETDASNPEIKSAIERLRSQKLNPVAK